MLWKSWGAAPPPPLLRIALLLLAAAAPLCSGAGDVVLSFSATPRRVSRSTSAAFAFRVLRATGGPCADCLVTCQLDGEPASPCGGSGGSNGTTAAASYAGLKDGNHTFTACARTTSPSNSSSSPTCATYAWDVDTVPPTASVSAGPAFTSAASTVSALVSFSEPCPGRGGFVCNATYCNLIVYGSGSVDPSTLQVLSPGLRYSVAVAISPDAQYGRLILVMGRGFCTDAAGHPFTRTPNSTFTLHFDRRSDSMNITATVPEKMLQIQGVTRLVKATNDDNNLRMYLSFAQPVLNSSEQILSALTATDAVLTPTNRSTLGNRRFGYVVNKMSDTVIVTVACDTSSIISRQGTPVVSAEPFTFLYDTQRPWVKLGTSTWRTSSRDISVLIKFAKPVFNLSSSAVQVSGGNVLRFHEASKSIYTLQIQAVDKLVSVQVAENAAQDVAGNPNLASDRLQVRHYSVPASSSWIAAITTVIFLTTAAVATLLTVSTSSLVASGAISRPSAYMISEPSRNVLRMACHIQIFALSRWLSVNLPIEYYEFAKGIEWSIPYMRLPWEGPAADPFLGYSTMPAIAYSELLGRSAVGTANISYPRAQGQPMMPTQIIPSDPVFPTEIPEDRKPTPPMQTPRDATPVMPVQTPLPLDGMPLTAMEYRSFFENPDMKPEAQIIMKLQDLDGWKYFSRNMFWLGVIGGGLILLHLLTLLYFKLRYRDGEQRQHCYGALVLPRLEIMVVVLAMPCVAQAAAALIRGGTTYGLVVGIVLTAVLTSFLVGLLLFLSLGITMGRLLQYKEVHQEAQEYDHWYQELVRRTLGPGKRGQWTWKDPRRAACLLKLGPLFEDLRGPPKHMLTQIATRGGGGGKRRLAGGGPERMIASEDENDDSEAPFIQKLFGVLRIYFTLLESVKRVAVGIVAGAHASSGRSSRAHAVAVLSVASFQLFFMLLKKPFIKKRVQLVEILSVASEVAVFAACLALIDRTAASGGGWLPDGEARGVGLAMLGAFVLGFAAQVCNEWNALYRQVRLLSADRSSFLDGAKTACLGLLLLVLPSSVLGKRVAVKNQQDPPPPDGGGAAESVSASTAADGGRGGIGSEGSRGSRGSNNERWWLRQLREMAKASFSKEGNAVPAGGGGEEASTSGSKARSGEWKSKSKSLYNDLEAIFSNTSR
ncbi:unnamed protein product [Miscanthus lutarioriparius]|uniref:Bacterial Ig-like domain-containing protein n=1 Tax=Miscanthus lutarioriparius TaxID=422564 RepID=A0A811RUG2_9POAL|nr:unnamed protein product [Miscanthus lutarioriparius]